MKVTMKYDQGVKKEEVVTLEIPETAFESMVEFDYQQRLALALPDDVVQKRTPVEIIEEGNRLEYNSWQTYKRNQVAWIDASTQTNLVGRISDDSQVETLRRQADYEELCQKIRHVLTLEQAEMIIAICLDEKSVQEYALEVGDKPVNVYERLRSVKKKLKNRLTENKDL